MFFSQGARRKYVLIAALRTVSLLHESTVLIMQAARSLYILDQLIMQSAAGLYKNSQTSLLMNILSGTSGTV